MGMISKTVTGSAEAMKYTRNGQVTAAQPSAGGGVIADGVDKGLGPSPVGYDKPIVGGKKINAATPIMMDVGSGNKIPGVGGLKGGPKKPNAKGIAS